MFIVYEDKEIKTRDFIHFGMMEYDNFKFDISEILEHILGIFISQEEAIKFKESKFISKHIFIKKIETDFDYIIDRMIQNNEVIKQGSN